MDEDDYLGVIDQMRLASDVPWTIPVLLLTAEAQKLKDGEEALIVDEDRKALAVLKLRGRFSISAKEYAMKVYGTEDVKHPGVARVMAGPAMAVAGNLKFVAAPDVGKFVDVTLTPGNAGALRGERVEYRRRVPDSQRPAHQS